MIFPDNPVSGANPWGRRCELSCDPHLVELGLVRAGVMSLLERAALMPKTGGGLPWIATTGFIAASETALGHPRGRGYGRSRNEDEMSDIARAVLVGRLTRDPELNSTGKVLTLGLAVNYRAKKGEDWVEEVSYFDVKVFGNRAPALHGFLKKGRQVAVDAKVVQERWQNDAGDNRSAVRFYADEVVPLGSKDENSSSNGSSSDIPSDTSDFAAAPAGATPAADDDIPF